MTINLYQSSAEDKRVDKTNYLTSAGTLTGTLKEETSIIDPSILIEQATLPTFNYIYIPDFNRYYFVSNPVSVRKNLWRINCHVDVLMSYKTGILNMTCLVARNEYNFTPTLEDERVFMLKNPIVSYVEIANSVLTKEYEANSVVLTYIHAPINPN